MMTTKVRIIITGSRSWTDVRTLELQMRIALAKYDPQAIVIVHGACPTGADRIADEFARRHQLAVERHPAQWRDGHGGLDRSAGFRRNAEMINAGADLCLAFIRGRSRGATHCANLAEAADIPVQRFRA